MGNIYPEILMVWLVKLFNTDVYSVIKFDTKAQLQNIHRAYKENVQESNSQQ